MNDEQRNDHQAEVDRNFEVFQKKLPELLESNPGEFALIRHGEIESFFDTARDAALAGSREYEDGLFSVQEVVDQKIDLGFYSLVS